MGAWAWYLLGRTYLVLGSLHIRSLPDPYPLPMCSAALGILSCKGMGLLLQMLGEWMVTDDESYVLNLIALHRNCIRLEQCSSFSNFFFKTVFPKNIQDVGISSSSSLRCSLWQRVLLHAIATGARGHDTFFWNWMYQESVGYGFSCSTRVVGHQNRGEVHLCCSFSEI